MASTISPSVIGSALSKNTRASNVTGVTGSAFEISCMTRSASSVSAALRSSYTGARMAGCSPTNSSTAIGVPNVTTGPADYGEEPGCRDRFASMLERHFVAAPTILGRTSHWRRAIPIPTGMNFCDWYMNLTMAETAPVVVIDKIIADYRVHPLNMHATKVIDGMGERVTLQVLDRFLYNSPRRAELAPRASAIMALHHADWGNKYFGARMDADASRCYRAALRFDPAQCWKGRFIHRYIGLLVGRTIYDRVKHLAHLLVASRLWA